MLFSWLIFSAGCERVDNEGMYYLADEARNYQIDTTVTSFKMIDNYGITEEYYMDGYQNQKHHYYYQGAGWYGEIFDVTYRSVLNDYFFMFSLRALFGDTELWFEMNQQDIIIYNFNKRKVTSDITPAIHFYDSLLVKGIKYDYIIEIDYSDQMDDLYENTPVKTYISGDKGTD